jgi:hypothetical protein
MKTWKVHEDDSLIAHAKDLNLRVLDKAEKALVYAKKAFNIAYTADENDRQYGANLEAARIALKAAQKERDAARADVDDDLDDDLLDDDNLDSDYRPPRNHVRR